MKTVGDRVQETSETSGTGTLDLSGAVSGHRTFVAEIGDGNTCHYLIEHRNGTEWELGIGTVTDAATDTLSRDTVLKSSNSDAKVDFSGGTKDVICTMPSGRSVLTDIKPTFSVDVDLGSNSLLNASIAAPLIDSGTLPDARIQESGVTQHEAALSIAESQIPDGSLLARLADAETVAGAWTFDGDVTLGMATQNYLVRDRNSDGPLAVQGQSVGTDSEIALMAKSGDGTDNVFLTLWGVGTPGSIADREFMVVGYESGSSVFEIRSAAEGTGTLRPLIFFTDGNYPQLALNTDGSITIGTDPGGGERLRVGGSARVEAELFVMGSDADTTFTGSGQFALKASNDAPLLTYHTQTGSRIGYLQMQAAGAARLNVGIAQDLELRTNDTVRMTIGADGKVGIGEKSPNFLLHEAGGSYAHLGAPASGPTTGDMDNGSVIFSVDETNNELDVTVKYSDGTVKTGTVSIS